MGILCSLRPESRGESQQGDHTPPGILGTLWPSGYVKIAIEHDDLVRGFSQLESGDVP